MKNTCLFPFYEYIFKEWIQNRRELPEYGEIFPEPFLHHREMEITSEVDRRRIEIWNTTRELQQMDPEEQGKKLRELQKRDENCSLCLRCAHCEQMYWKELDKALFHNQTGLEARSPLMLPEYIKNILEQREKPVDIYLDRHRRRHFLEQNCLIMLKAFSSSMPILLNYAEGSENYSGGGFYIRWQGCGIAVDPGYRFIERLHEAGYSVLDIDVVIITHEHIDHTNDIRLLDDLHYNAARQNMDYEYRWDSELFSIVRGPVRPHRLSWYMDSVTCQMIRVLSEKESGFNPECNDLYCVNIDPFETEDLKERFKGYAEVISDPIIRIGTDIIMNVFPTSHETYKKDGRTEFFHHTFGCVFECSSRDAERQYIGYTSDTSLCEPSLYKKMMDQLQKCQIIIANISGIYEKDVLLQTAKAKHLGYMGCYRIIYDILTKEQSKLRYYLLSEFSNQVSDIRYDISKYLQWEVTQIANQTEQEIPLVLPAETGLAVSLDTYGIQCSSCKKYSKNIHVIKPCGENQKLRYVCGECVYSR